MSLQLPLPLPQLLLLLHGVQTNFQLTCSNLFDALQFSANPNRASENPKESESILFISFPPFDVDKCYFAKLFLEQQPEMLMVVLS